MRTAKDKCSSLIGLSNVQMEEVFGVGQDQDDWEGSKMDWRTVCLEMTSISYDREGC